MARIAGRLGRIAVSSDGGSTFVILGCLIDGTLNGSNEELDVTCHEDGQFKDFISGRKDATIDASLHWDEADAGQVKVKDAFFADSILRVRFRMQEATGLQEYEANSIVTNFSPTSPNDDVADVDVTFRLKGDFTPTAQP